jgi:hypothetical protein
MFGITEIDGIPVHPLVVHAAVVLIPLAVLALIALGWRQEWRRSYALPIALMAIAGAAAAFIAAQTGESVEHTIRDAASATGQRANFGDHPEQGTTAEIASIVFAAFAVIFWAVQEWPERLQLSPRGPYVSYGISAIAGIVAVATIVIAGHSGAALVWKDVGTYVAAR